MNYHLVIERTVWAIKELPDEVCPLDAPSDHIVAAVPLGGLPPDMQVVQLQQQLPPDGQRPVIAPHSNLHIARVASQCLQLHMLS